MNELSLICPKCKAEIIDDLLSYVYGTFWGSMPGAIQFYCPNCKTTLDIYLEWSRPRVRTVEIMYPKGG